MNERPPNTRDILIFTDLDGCLLDHDDYSFDGARKTLHHIKKTNLPLIIATSKTRAEVEELRRILDVDHPFIVENGGAIFFPQQYEGLNLSAAETRGAFRVLKLGRDYPEIRLFFESVKDTYKVRGFGDMDVAEISKRTGLPYMEAQLARAREFSEPFVFVDTDRADELEAEAARSGFDLTRGGRFYHLIGKDQSKGRAVRHLIALYRRSLAGPIVTLGVGDGKNDEEMLREVDIGILVPHPDGNFEKFDVPNLRRALSPGSSGWGTSVMEVLNGLAKNSMQAGA